MHAIANANENDSRLAAGARIVPGARKQHKKYISANA